MTARAGATARRGTLGLLAALVAFLLAVGATPQLVATSHADTDACAAQKVALDADNKAIDDHNARMPPGGVGPPEVAGPYNREAAELNARGAADAAKLESCRAATNRLRDNGPQPKDLSDRVRNVLDQARRNTPPGWRAPDPLVRNPRNQDVVIPTDSPARAVYDAVRDYSPPRPFACVPLQGQTRPNVGDASTAVPGQVVGQKKDGSPAVSADHIVPLAEVVQLPRFMELSSDNMWRVINAPLNLQWLDSRVNRAKGSKDISDVLGVDETWRAGQLQLQDKKRQELIQIIAQLADSQID